MLKLFLEFMCFEKENDNHKIMYKSINSITSLPLLSRPRYIVIKLDPPLARDKAEHSYIIVEFKDAYEVEIKPRIAEKKYAEKFEKKLNRVYKGDMRDVIVSLLEGLSGSEATNDQCVAFCSLEDRNCLLYQLEESIFALTIPPFLISHENINCIQFAKSEGCSNQYFDLRTELKTGEEHLFRSIKIRKLSRLSKFFSSKGLTIKNSVDGGDDKENKPGESDHEEKLEDAQHDKILDKGKQKIEEEKPAVSFAYDFKKKLVEEGVTNAEFDERIADEWNNLKEELKSYYRKRDEKGHP